MPLEQLADLAKLSVQRTKINAAIQAVDSNTANKLNNGDVAAGNYAYRDEDGQLRLYGNATQFRDLNFAIIRSGGPAATRPAEVTIGGLYYREFTSSNNQSCGDSDEIPHETKLSSSLYPHCHIFLKSGESEGTTGVTFTLTWAIIQSDGVVTGTSTFTATSAQLLASPYKLDLYDTEFAGYSELGAAIVVKLARTAGNAGDIIVTSYGLHYEVDSSGSDSITTKYSGD